MKPARAALITLAAALALGGCGSGKEAPPPPSASGELAPGTVARVGRHAVTVPLVAHVAQAQRVPLPEARDRAVRDALLASEAEALHLDQSADVQMATRAILARRLLQDLAGESAKAPISDEELRAATEQHWLELDRPEGFEVVHAVIRLDPKDDEAKRAAARTLAEAMRAALAPLHERLAELPRPAPSPDPRSPGPDDPLGEAFIKAAEAAPHVGFELRAEKLQPFAADGRVLDPSGRGYDADFARGAATLKERGELTPVVSSPFGMHVIMLLERTPEQRVPEAERRAKLHDEILRVRARGAAEQVLAGARSRASRASDADALLARVGVEP